MQREIREVDLTDLSRPDVGSVAPWVRVMIFGAALAMIGVAAASMRALWNSGWHEMPLSDYWFRNGLAIALAAAAAAAFLPPSRVSRFVRLAVLLPILLVAGMMGAWALWALSDLRLSFLRQTAPLILRVPIAVALAVMLAATCVAALAAQRRRAVGWARATVATALVELLLLGLWLPILSWWWARRSDIGWVWDDGAVLSLGSPALLIALALGPPLVLAAAFAALGSHRPDLARRTRPVWLAALLLLLAGAVAARLAVTTNRSSLIYLNLVHFLAASALVAAVAL